MSYPMIIGITGPMGSGKGEVAKFLAKKGFEHLTYSDIVKEEARIRKIEPTRENLQKLGSYLKKENLGMLSKKLLQLAKTKKFIADGIRTIAEINELKKQDDFYLIGIIAPQRLRYKRLGLRKRQGDPNSFKAFKTSDNRENRGKTAGQQINECVKQADFIINNNGSLSTLHEKIETIIKKIMH